MRAPDDIRKDPKFEGQTSFMLKYVPLKSVDESTTVGEDTLREYLIYALLEEDPVVKKFQESFDLFKERLAAVDRKIKAISKMQFVGLNHL